MLGKRSNSEINAFFKWVYLTTVGHSPCKGKIDNDMVALTRGGHNYFWALTIQGGSV